MTENRHRFLVRIDGPRDTLEWRESLELILAGAAIELDLQVVLGAVGGLDLAANRASASAWRQLIDHQLADVAMLSDGSDSQPDAPYRLAWMRSITLEELARSQAERVELWL